MWKFMILGVADAQSNSQAVTKQDFTELENGIYEKAKTLQDTANSIQSDQIDFLQNNISTFFTVCGIAVSVLVVLVSGALTYIAASNRKAKKHMEAANKLMASAQALSEQAAEKTEFLENKQKELEELLNSKELERKLSKFEKSAVLTTTLQNQMNTSLNLQSAAYYVTEARKIYKFVGIGHDGDLYEEQMAGVEKCDTQEVRVYSCQAELKISTTNPEVVNETQIYEESRGLLQQSLKLYSAAHKFKEKVNIQMD
ncbi:hypothetical protein EMIT0210MI2_250127 [Priestia megaterium]